MNCSDRKCWPFEHHKFFFCLIKNVSFLIGCEYVNLCATGVIGGPWLKFWTQAGAVLSSVGMFEAQLSSGAFQLLGMADLGLLPAVFARRAARLRTPWVAVAVSSAVTLAVSFLAFDEVVATANFLYSLGTLLEFAAFLWLRARQPDLKRPYRVPLSSLPALAAMCAVPSAFLAYVCAVAGWRVFALAGALTALGVGLHGSMRLCRAKRWLKFEGQQRGHGGHAAAPALHTRFES